MMKNDVIAALRRAAENLSEQRDALLTDMEAVAVGDSIEIGRIALQHGADAATIRDLIADLQAGRLVHQEVATAFRQADFEAGVVNERARVVAWLRTGGADEIVTTHECYLRDLADAIAAGAHIGGGDE